MEHYYAIRNDREPLHIKPGKRVSVRFSSDGIEYADALHFTGETSQFYQWKNEPDYPMLYLRIDDSLRTDLADRAQYCLDLSAQNFDYPIVAYHKLLFPPKLSYLRLKVNSNRWTLGLKVKTEGLKISEDGYLRFRAEVRYANGEDPNSLKRPADETFDLELPQGTRDWTELSREICFQTARVASVCLYLEGERYEGKVYAESPSLRCEEGWNLLPEFEPKSAERPQFTWTGWNLSKKEWPAFEIALNGSVFFRGNIFERCHRRSEAEIPLNGVPLLPEENELTFTRVAQGRDPLAYDLYDVALTGRRPSFLVACPRIVTVGKNFAVFVEGKRGETVSLTGAYLTPVDLTLDQDGLNAVLLRCDEPKNGIGFTLSLGNEREECFIERCVLRADDGVLTGTGDQVYVPAEEWELRRFLKWYLEQEIGNLITVRPTYRWCGTRARNEALWKRFAALMSKAGLAYVHMTDGRELPGCDTNPSTEALQGAGFLGHQHHELDGAISYWGLFEHTDNPSIRAYIELLQRRYRTHARYMRSMMADPNALMEKEGRRLLFHDLTLPHDMEVLANASVGLLASVKNGASRHTGPSTLFKYFYQAGYDWTGAELMYGPQETICAALRGAARAYGKPAIGAHHALQWSTTPHDSPEKNKRYRLALFGTYLQGVDHINTEEGLWHVEEYYTSYNRFSDSCKNHTKQQRDFYRYVQTHARTGEFKTPIAFLHGRFDGWDVFTQKQVWGRREMGFSDAEKAWELLKYFYPRNVMHSIYLHPCPKQSVGYYSGTPYGNVDMLPAEACDYAGYRLLVAAGYNKAIDGDLDKMERFVSEGGTLVIGWPQLSVTTARKDVVGLNHTYVGHPFRDRIAPKEAFVPDTYEGLPVTVCPSPIPTGASPQLLTDEGRTLAYTLPVGEGTVVFMNAKQYAGDPAVYSAYTKILDRTVARVLEEESVYGRGDDAVQFAVYRQSDGSDHVYFMATDWYNDDEKPRTGYLTVEGTRYGIDAPMGTPIKAVVANKMAAWCNEGEGDVLSLSDGKMTVQGIGTATFRIAQNGTLTERSVDFAKASVQTLSLTAQE